MRYVLILKTAGLCLCCILILLTLISSQDNNVLSTIVENYSQVGNNDSVIVKISERAEFKPKTDNDGGNVPIPTFKYEDTRKQMELNLKEMSYSIIRAQNDKVTHPALESLKDIYRLLQSQLQTLRNSDGFESFRERETKELSEIFEDRINLLQNPNNCSTAKKLVCTFFFTCGFGCLLTHATQCFVTAYILGYTLILDSSKWIYNQENGGWEAMFLPMSESCTNVSGQEEKVFRFLNFGKDLPPHLPVSIPSDIGDRLVKAHGEPYVWWVGQFKKYLLRLQPTIKEILEEEKNSLGFLKSPIVGVHVRRTDKFTEAQFHNLTEYMRFAEDWFAIKDLEQPPGTPPLPRRVFIATDDPTVIEEARQSYGNLDWEIIGDTEVAESASLKSRYSNKSAHGVVRDVFLLSECDFLVCTFSSQICRLAYELLQTKHTDGSWRAQSLDDIYFYTGGNGLRQIAILPHEPRNSGEIELQVGDEIGIWGNHWDGFSKGENLRTRQQGLYPSYKAKYVVRQVAFPDKPWWLDMNERS